jgi:hypothetical protein
VGKEYGGERYATKQSAPVARRFSLAELDDFAELPAARLIVPSSLGRASDASVWDAIPAPLRGNQNAIPATHDIENKARAGIAGIGPIASAWRADYLA